MADASHLLGQLAVGLAGRALGELVELGGGCLAVAVSNLLAGRFVARAPRGGVRVRDAGGEQEKNRECEDSGFQNTAPSDAVTVSSVRRSVTVPTLPERTISATSTARRR